MTRLTYSQNTQCQYRCRGELDREATHVVRLALHLHPGVVGVVERSRAALAGAVGTCAVAASVVARYDGRCVRIPVISSRGRLRLTRSPK